jgi:hypothetical protein
LYQEELTDYPLNKLMVTTHPRAKPLINMGVKWLQPFYSTAKAVELRHLSLIRGEQLQLMIN